MTNLGTPHRKFVMLSPRRLFYRHALPNKTVTRRRCDFIGWDFQKQMLALKHLYEY